MLHRVVAWLNPFTPFTRSYQDVLFYGSLPAWELWLQMLAWGALIWWLGTWLFDRLSESLAEAV
jgi:ABC-type polysaccharide/polyol phosphate export permease